MNCIISSFPSIPLRPKLLHSRHKSPFHFPQISYLSPQTQRFVSLNEARAIPNSLFLAANIPPQTSDLSLLLPTGGLLLVVYFIANFIVPELIMKSYRSDEDEERKNEVKAPVKDDEEEEEEEDEDKAESLRMKKKGFGSNKR